MVIMTITLMGKRPRRMVDIHSHIIPMIDDGARDEAEALSLLRLAQDDGITHIVATPHIHSGRFENTQHSIQTGLTLLKQLIFDNQLSIKVAAACELRLDVEHMATLASGNIPILGVYKGYKLILLEFPHSHIPVGADSFIKWLIKNKYRPVIAHPERNRDFQKFPNLLNPFIKLGCLTQVTARSITGEFGESAHTLVTELLNEKKVAVVASDAHNIKRRPPILSRAFQEVAHKYGSKRAETLFITNPKVLCRSLFQ